MPPGRSPQQRHSNLYVKNLADHITDEILHSIFEPNGAVKSACVMVDQATQESRNFGFVKFEHLAGAEKAIQNLHGREVGGRKLVVKFADSDSEGKDAWEGRPTDNLYVKGLPGGMSAEQLNGLFSQYGGVTQLKMLARQGQGSAGEALVRMGDISEATWAIQNLNLTVPPGATERITVRYADSYEDKQTRRKMDIQQRKSRFGGGGGGVSGGGGGGAGGGGFQPNSHQGMGNPHYLMMSPGGGGFPPMPAPDGSWGVPPVMQQQQLSMAGALMPAVPPGTDLCNLYVNDLPLEADDLFLYRLFSPLGAITSVRIMRDEAGTSKGFGFVKFVHAHDAMGAIRAVHGKQLSGRPVQVSHKTVSKHKSPGPGGVAMQGGGGGAGGGYLGADMMGNRIPGRMRPMGPPQGMPNMQGMIPLGVQQQRGMMMSPTQMMGQMPPNGGMMQGGSMGMEGGPMGMAASGGMVPHQMQQQGEGGGRGDIDQSQGPSAQ